MSDPLDYAPPPRPRIATRYMWRALMAAVVLLVGGYWAHAGLTELRLRRESTRLLTANAPLATARWANVGAVTFTADGFLLLPDGQLARIEGMRRAKFGKPAEVDPTPVITEAMTTLRAAAVGYTVVGTDAKDGVPVVQVWALSPRAYVGMCGSSTTIERRYGAMRLWRNVGMFAGRHGEPPFDTTAMPTPISVLGY